MGKTFKDKRDGSGKHPKDHKSEGKRERDILRHLRQGYVDLEDAGKFDESLDKGVRREV